MTSVVKRDPGVSCIFLLSKVVPKYYRTSLDLLLSLERASFNTLQGVFTFRPSPQVGLQIFWRKKQKTLKNTVKGRLGHHSYPYDVFKIHKAY